MSRGHWRGPPKISVKTPSTPQKKSLKPLPSNAARASTKYRRFSDFSRPSQTTTVRSQIKLYQLVHQPRKQKPYKTDPAIAFLRIATLTGLAMTDNS